MGTRTYRTDQRRQVLAYLEHTSDRYQTVDQVFEGMHAVDAKVGRTTVYRTLERLARDGVVAKVATIQGHAAAYRLLDDQTARHGQLLCTHCGRVLPLGCSMLQPFAEHVRDHHGFAIDQTRTVICGVCEACQRAEGTAGGTRREDA